MTTTTTTKKKTVTKRSPRSKRPSQVLDGVALKTESSVASATTVSRSVKRRAVALAYDNGDDGAVKVELKQDELGQVVSVDNVSPVADTTKVKPAVASPQKKKRASKTDEMRVKREQPAQWEAMLSGIQAMRAKRKAEVDTMGCEMFETDKSEPHVWRFHTLVSAMLSSQTKDPINAAAMARLIAREGGLTVQAMLDIDENELAQVIHPVGFYRNKARYIKQVASILKTQAAERSGKEEPDVIDIPATFEGLLALPGVGPKMAYLVMDCAWHNVVGICVDTHVHRISNRLGWVKTWNTKNPKAQDPEKTRHELEDWLPREHWGPINVLLVGFGQTICQPRGPKCGECAISHLCPSANSSAI
ncbi:hypothetical protein Gpo141_00008143 [Globisporangium polare]